MDVGAEAEAVRRAVGEVAAGFAADRAARQGRTHLERADFDALAAAGFLRTGLPVERGGLWESPARSTRGVAEILRALAHGDPSVALVSSMHPSVLAWWLATPEVPEPHAAAWQAQRDEVFTTVEAGAWWGTATSEPGSGGDVHRTTAVARPAGDHWVLSGRKHFASGSGITSFMLTTAVPEGETDPDWFLFPTTPGGATPGVTIVAPWDGVAMRATQSHGLALDGCAARRLAWPGHLDDVVDAARPLFGLLFVAVVLGVVETAVATARAALAGRPLGPYEQVEWARAVNEAWTLEQVFSGALGAVERGEPAGVPTARAKVVGAELAESCLLRTSRVVGGGSLSARSPISGWFEDVRALGFLRPPWALAFDGLIAASRP